MRVKPHAALLLVVPLLGVGACQPNPDSTTLFEDVGMSFEPCTEAEIKWMNKKHGMMPALRVCGSNNVAHYAWNPSGTHLYFDLTLTGNVLDASQQHKPLTSLPIDQPTGQATWLNDQRVAIPVVPGAKDDKARERIAIYDIQQYSLEYKKIADLSGITDLARGKDPSTIFFTGVGADGARRAWRLDVNDGSVSPAFEWLTDPVDTFSYTSAAGLVVIGRGEQVTLWDEAGAPRGTFVGRRGVVHPAGKWLALERDGDEVSVFYQRAWEDMSRREREIAEKKARELGERFPDWYPKTVKLPTLEFVDLPSGKRGEVRSFYGTRFQWYEHTDYYGSFLLWGYEGKQLNRNVMLGNLRLRLGSIEHEKDVNDVRRLEPVTGLAPAAPAVPADTDAPADKTAEEPGAAPG